MKESLKIPCGKPGGCEGFLEYDKGSRTYHCPLCHYEVSETNKKKLRELNDTGDTQQTKLKC